MKLTPYGEKLVLNAHTVQFHTNVSVEYIDQVFNSTDKILGKIIYYKPTPYHLVTHCSVFLF